MRDLAVRRALTGDQQEQPNEVETTHGAEDERLAWESQSDAGDCMIAVSRTRRAVHRPPWLVPRSFDGTTPP